MLGKYSNLMAELDSRKSKVISYLSSSDFTQSFRPAHIQEAVMSYILAGGKSLRPAILMLACGSLNDGDEEIALPAACAVEAYHTWSLVHDDIIDRDLTRRGVPTVHDALSSRAKTELGLPVGEADHYGISLGILAGDAQLGWSVRLLWDLQGRGVRESIVLELIKKLTWDVLNTLIEGETLDVQYSKRTMGSLDENQIIEMLWKKTGVLYEYCGTAGAMLGLDTDDDQDPLVASAGKFASDCGIAFQIQDDILGVVGTTKALGKPVGSDIREGKKTAVAYFAIKNASESERKKLLRNIGDVELSPEQLAETIRLLQELGGVQESRDLARRFVDRALQSLSALPKNSARSLLEEWANFLIDREY